MNLNNVAVKFATTTIDVWRNGRWEKSAVIGSLKVSNRFLTDMDTGMSRRLFISPGEIPADCTMARFHNGSVYLIEHFDSDIDIGEHSFRTTLLRADNLVEIGSVTTTTSASGMKRSQGEEFSDPIPCLLYRSGSRESSVSSNIHMSRKILFMPNHLTLKDSNSARVDGKVYKVAEVYKSLNLLVASLTD